ncbi:MAG: dihydroorotase [Opitutae bacterium]|nr:dihydroorotase [Opitutae bacterium]
MTDYCLRGARVIDPSQELDGICDLTVANGSITFASPDDSGETLDCSGKIIMPGMVDIRGHLQEPESLSSASNAAASGGYTTILIMPNSGPPADNPGAVHLMREKASKDTNIEILQCGCLTKASEGEILAPLGSLKEAGVVAVSDCPSSPQNTEIFARGLEYASMFDLPVIEFPRDLAISSSGVAHDGPVALKMGIGGYPRMAEELFVQRAITVCRNLGTKVHLTSISSVGSVELIREAKGKGISVTADATPHHLALTDECLLGYDSNSKTMPPLREELDRKAILGGVQDGTIDCISSAHEPCHKHEKEVEFDLAPAGVTGYETALSVVLGELAKSMDDPFPLITKLMSLNPSRILDVDNTIAEGRKANLFVFDPNRNWRYQASQGRSAAKNSPYEGFDMKGSVMTTFSNGEKVFTLS